MGIRLPEDVIVLTRIPCQIAMLASLVAPDPQGETSSAQDPADRVVARAMAVARRGELNNARRMVAGRVTGVLSARGGNPLTCAAELQQLADAAVELYDFATGERACRGVLSLLQACSPDHLTALQNARRKWAQVLLRLGRGKEALELLGTAVECLAKIPDAGEQLVDARIQLAQAHLATGQHVPARNLADALYEELAGKNGKRLADVTQLLGNVLAAIGDRRGALEMDERLLKAAKESRNTFAVIDAKLNLGSSKAQVGQFDEAIGLQRDAIRDLEEHDADPDSLMHAKLMLATTLGRHARSNGDEKGYREALAVLIEVVEGLERAGRPAGSRIWIQARINLAVTHASLGQLERSSELFEQVVESYRKKQADGAVADDQDCELALQGLASALYALGSYADARCRMQQAIDLTTRRLRRNTTSLSLREKVEFHAKLHHLVSSLLSCRRFRTTDTELDRADLRSVVRFQGLAERHGRVLALAHEMGRSQPDVARALEDLRKAGRAAHLAAGSSRLLPQLEAERERAERELLGRLGEAVGPSRERSLDELAGFLPRDAVAVVTFRYGRYPPVRPGQMRSNPTDHFSGFLLTPDGTTRRFELGTADVLAKEVRAFRTALTRGVKNTSRLSVLLGPLLAAIPVTAKTLFVCPDAELASIPWAALDLPGGALAADRYRIVYGDGLTALLPRTPSSLPASLLVVGDVAYGRGSTWKRLFGTRLEMHAVEEAFRAAFAEGTLQRLARTGATKSAFVQAAPRFRFLHVATHGFARGLHPTVGGPSSHRDFTTGLVFAGANEREDDAVLLAEELLGMNLSSCEVAVLSACDTNRGLREFGEAVTGLNRGLHLAGAQATVTTLWRLPDADTGFLLQQLYRRLWSDKKSVTDAFADAVQDARARDLPPRIWAGFALYGRP